MEQSLYFFLAGLAVFGIKIVLPKNTKEWIRVLAFLMLPSIMLLIMSSFFGPLVPEHVNFPKQGIVLFLSGLFAGLVLYLADRTEFIFRPGIKYFATFFLGFIISGISFGISSLFCSIYNFPQEPTQLIGARIIYFLLSGFLIVFGFTFPSRFFRKK
ncbi:hypothetical protein J7K93_07850 [bacterium]|nr:hypothetical protein [bacterium]